MILLLQYHEEVFTIVMMQGVFPTWSGFDDKWY